MIRFPWEKYSENVDTGWMDNFNTFISDGNIKERIRKWSRFIWTNKQENPVMCVLDRVFSSADWDQHYPLTTCHAGTRVGSDHCPIFVNTEDSRVKQQHQFRFEMAWLT